MAVDTSLAEDLAAFGRAIAVHWFPLALAALLVIEAVLSPFRRDKPPEGRRVGLLLMAGIAVFIACFQAFNAERVQRLTAQQSIDSAQNSENVVQNDRDAIRAERDRVRSERDNLATQLAAEQKQLDESRAVVAADRLENGSQQHPFSDKARCPPGLAVIENSQTVGSSDNGSAQTKRREPVCFVETKGAEVSPGKAK